MGARPEEALKQYIAKHGLKTSRQRELIASVFFAVRGHVSIDELVERVKQTDTPMRREAVHRAMKLFMQAGLAEARQFGDGPTLYEVARGQEGHHDHLICTSCGSITEFSNARIEALQSRVASRHRFVVTHHKMELYGLCAACRPKKSR